MVPTHIASIAKQPNDHQIIYFPASCQWPYRLELIRAGPRYLAKCYFLWWCRKEGLSHYSISYTRWLWTEIYSKHISSQCTILQQQQVKQNLASGNVFAHLSWTCNHSKCIQWSPLALPWPLKRGKECISHFCGLSHLEIMQSKQHVTLDE